MPKHCPFHFLKNKHENKSCNPGYTLPSLCLHPEAPPAAPSLTSAAPALDGPTRSSPSGRQPGARRIPGSQQAVSSGRPSRLPPPASGSVEAEPVPWSPVSPAPHQNSAGPHLQRLLSELIYTELPPHPGQKGFTKKSVNGLPCWLGGKESACPRKRRGLHPRHRQIPPATEQLHPRAPTAEPARPIC